MKKLILLTIITLVTLKSFSQTVTKTNIEVFKKFFHFMLDEGVYLAPSAYEAGFTSIAHSDEVIDAIISAAEKSFQKLK